jgi:hypothetical protein
VRFGLTGASVIQETLEARLGLPAAEADALARAAGGRVGVAFAWATDSEVLERRHRLLTLLTETEAHRQAARDRPGRAVVAFRLAETLRELVPSDATAAGTRNALAAMLDLALAYYRDRLLLSVGAPASVAVVAPDPSDRTDPTDPNSFLRAIDTVLESQQFLERNVAPPLVLERMFACLIGDTRSD